MKELADVIAVFDWDSEYRRSGEEAGYGYQPSINRLSTVYEQPMNKVSTFPPRPWIPAARMLPSGMQDPERQNFCAIR